MPPERTFPHAVLDPDCLAREVDPPQGRIESIEASRWGVDVLFLIRSLEYGGAQRQLVVLARELHSRGWRVAVATYYGGGALERELIEDGVRLLDLGKRGRWDLAGFGLRLIRTVRRVRPRVFHAYLPSANVIATLACRLAGGPRLVWGIRAAHMDLKQYDWTERAVFALTRVLARRADALIVNSDAGREYHVVRGYPASRMTVIPNGIDTTCFAPDADVRQRERARLGLAEDEMLVGIVGRLDPMKDHRTFFEAASLLSGREPRVRFLVVGSGEPTFARELRDLPAAQALGGRLFWEVNRPDAAAVYNALDLLVSSSSGEGFPNVVGEAMATGVPCVVTAVGDSPRIVGSTGAVVPAGDAAAMALAMGQMLYHVRLERATLAAACRQQIVDEFSVTRLCERTECVLWPDFR